MIHGNENGSFALLSADKKRIAVILSNLAVPLTRVAVADWMDVSAAIYGCNGNPGGKAASRLIGSPVMGWWNFRN